MTRRVRRRPSIATLVTLLTLAGAGLQAPRRADAHRGHAEVAPGIIDPLRTHHAVLEDELKLNTERPAGGGFDASLELAVALSDAWGLELFVPVSLLATGGASDDASGLGDIDIQVPKWSFVRRPALVVTTTTAIRLPTAPQSEGWGIAPHLFVDAGVGRFGIQSNAAVEWSPDDVAIEGRTSVAWTAAIPGAVRVSPLVEAGVEQPLSTAGEDVELAVLAGLKAGLRGWHLGLGAEFPVRESEGPTALLQLGYHVDWGAMFRPRRAPATSSMPPPRMPPSPRLP